MAREEQRKKSLLEYIKKRDEQRKMDAIKKKQEMEEQSGKAEELRRQIEEKRKKAIDDWMQNKLEQERERRIQERSKKESDEIKRLQDLENDRIRRAKERMAESMEKKRERGDALLGRGKDQMIPIRHINTLKSSLHGPWDILESPESSMNATHSATSPFNRKKRKVQKRKKIQPTLSDIYGIKRPRLSETNTEDLRKSKSALEQASSSKYLGFDNIFYN